MAHIKAWRQLYQAPEVIRFDQVASARVSIADVIRKCRTLHTALDPNFCTGESSHSRPGSDLTCFLLDQGRSYTARDSNPWKWSRYKVTLTTEIRMLHCDSEVRRFIYVVFQLEGRVDAFQSEVDYWIKSNREGSIYSGHNGH